MKDPAVAKLLQPTTYPIGTKRICIDTDYFETFNRDNVTLVDIRNAPITEITPKGIVTGGKEYECDAIVFATGFDAMTGSFARIDIRGRDGLTLKDKWEEGPKTYLGLMVAGFPNMFLVTGPGSPSVLSNMIVSIEQHVDWIADCLAYQRDQRHRRASRRRKMRKTAGSRTSMRLRTTRSIRRRTPGTWARTFPASRACSCPYIGGIPAYRAICNEVVANGYRGFALTRQHRVAAAE